MTIKSAVAKLLSMAQNEALSKKVRREHVDLAEQMCRSARIKAPAALEEIRARIETTRSGGVSRPVSVIGRRIVELLRETNDEGYRRYSHKEIADIVCRENPGSKTTDKSVASTLRDLDKDVKASIPARKPKAEPKERLPEIEVSFEDEDEQAE